jgi:hypothetical protein
MEKINLKTVLSDLKKVLGLTLIVTLFVSGVFVFAEPSVTRASVSDTKTVVVTLSVTAGISLTVDSTVSAMSTALSLSQNSSVGTSTFTVATNNALGYTLSLSASSTAPAMQTTGGTYTIPDATTTPTAYPAVVPTNTYKFGFSAYSTTTTDVPAATWESGGHAGGCSNAANTPSATLLYRGFNGNTLIPIAQNSSTTTTAGNTSVVCFMAAQNGAYAPSGSYTATILGTATTK